MSDALDCLTRLGEPQAYGGNPAHWDEAMAARPAGPLPFLDIAAIPARRRALGLADDADAPMAAAAAAIAADPDLAQFLWYIHWRVYVAPERGIPWGAPSLDRRLGDLSGAAYMLLGLEFPLFLTAVHRKRGYPPDVTAETLKQIVAYDINHRRGRGWPGMYGNQFPWFATYLTDPYVRLGRLEFQLHTYRGGVNAWRRTRDGAVLALAEDGVRVDATGLRLRQDAPPNEGWTTRYVEEEAVVVGSPVDPAGRILPGTVRLDRSEWGPCLRRGDGVLDMHIPAGGGMTWEACADSFRRALAFFPHYHPDLPFVGVVVSTWFMDPQLAEVLPQTANPLRLQRATYMYPPPPAPGGMWFIFQQSTDDPAKLPRDSSLRRALAAFLETGRTWHGGGMFLLREDMAHPREGMYRERFARLRAELSMNAP